MKLYLAGTNVAEKWIENGDVKPSQLYVLESFVSIKKWQVNMIPSFKDFILDSGAFTFMNAQKKQNVDWYDYAERYANFCKKNNIKKYFELDIDRIIGLAETTKLREHIEHLVGWPSIPVWHETRDKDYWLDMCSNYPYVAIGGIASKKSNRNRAESMFPWFIKTAHQHGAKIHGLGYTNVLKIQQFRFDSIDSTTWTAGSRYGQLHVFRNNRIEKKLSIINGVKKRTLINPNEAHKHNFLEWVKFSEYCDKFL